MSLFDTLQRGDNAALSLHQSIYDYVWDRWGIYVGTFRSWLAVLAFSDSIVIDVVKSFSVGLLHAIPSLLITFTLIWLFFCRKHLGEEWKLQDEGRYSALNASAIQSQGIAGLVGRSLIVVILVGLVALLDRSGWQLGLRYMGIGFFVCWSYGCGVMVREREPDRFRVAAPQGA